MQQIPEWFDILVLVRRVCPGNCHWTSVVQVLVPFSRVPVVHFLNFFFIHSQFTIHILQTVNTMCVLHLCFALKPWKCDLESCVVWSSGAVSFSFFSSADDTWACLLPVSHRDARVHSLQLLWPKNQITTLFALLMLTTNTLLLSASWASVLLAVC